MKDPGFLARLREAFAIEAAEHVQAMTAGLIELEKTREPSRRKELIETIFLEAHSLKGAARAVDHAHIQTVCQALEGVFASWKKNAPDVSADAFDVLNRAVDLAGRLLRSTDAGSAAADSHAVTAMAAQITAIGASAPPSVGSPQARAGAGVATAADPQPARPEKNARGEREAAPPAPPAPPPAEDPGWLAGTAAGRETEGLHLSDTVRISLTKMDALLRQAEEMTSAKLAARQHVMELQELGEWLAEWHQEWAKVRDLVRSDSANHEEAALRKAREFMHWNHGHVRTMETRLSALLRTAAGDERNIVSLVDELMEEAKRLMMLPFSTLLDLFPKMVRDISRDLGKQVNFICEGREVEIDKRILQEMKDPLIHLVRNSIDHGIEKGELRTRSGKPPFGNISIAVSQHEGNKVEITVSDDGGGIPVEKLKATAVRNGILSEDEARGLDEQAALALVYESGLSTSPIVTEISGRGLGMVIVREKVDKLGGSISIGTSPGKGTSFRILVPITLAAFKGIVVFAGGQRLVIPTAGVERVARFRRDEVQTVENKDTILIEGRPVSLVQLDAVLEIQTYAQHEQTDFTEAVVLGSGERRIAFAVDEVRNEQEVLVKPIGKPLLRVRNVAGATVLGSGAPVVILSTADLLRSAVRAAAAGHRRETGVKPDRAKTVTQKILVTDDSVTSRMLLKNILESAGYHVTTAFDGVDAMTALKTQDFDLLVSDVEMPRMDGFDLTAKIRADKKLAELPVVLVTALSSREHIERGVDVGANAYVVKSKFDQTNLLEVIRKLI